MRTVHTHDKTHSSVWTTLPAAVPGRPCLGKLQGKACLGDQHGMLGEGLSPRWIRALPGLHFKLARDLQSFIRIIFHRPDLIFHNNQERRVCKMVRADCYGMSGCITIFTARWRDNGRSYLEPYGDRVVSLDK